MSKYYRAVAALFFVSVFSANQQNLSLAEGATNKKGTASTSSNSVSVIKPLFAKPATASIGLALYFVGRDASVLQGMDFSNQAAAARNSELLRLSNDFKLRTGVAAQTSQLGEMMLKLYEEQALYYENLAGFGLSTPNITDIYHSIKVARSAHINHIDQLIKQFPKSAAIGKWKSAALVSRLKIGDPSVVNEALKFMRSSKSGDGIRVKLIGATLDFLKGVNNSPFGSPQNLLELPMDAASKAALQLFSAEKLASKSPKKAIDLYQEAAKGASGLRTAEGRYSVITVLSSARIVEISLQYKPENVDQEVVSLFKELGTPLTASYYIEKVAFNVMKKQPVQAMKLYADIIQNFNLPPADILNVNHVILSIAINSENLDATEKQWQQIMKLSGGMNVVGTENRVVATQKMNWKNVEKNPSGSTVDRYIRMHDAFKPVVDTYRNNDEWEIKALEALSKIKRDTQLANRADLLFTSAVKTDVKVTALRYASRARERLLGIEQTPSFAKNKKLNGGTEVLSAYISTMDKLEPLTKGVEAETCAFQAAYITHISANIVEARQKFEAALGKYPKSVYAGKTVSFLLELAAAKKDYAYTEKIARLTEAKRIKPSNIAYANLRSVIEIAVYEQANVLANQKQFEPAAQKYVAFQKEFVKSEKADNALDLAAKNYLQAKKIELAIDQMELLLQQYPNSSFAKENRWQAAEQSRTIGQFLRAANHYEAFAKEYSKEGELKKAWYKAAEMHKSVARYANAVTDYEKYLNQISSKVEKVKIAKEIADVHVKFGKSSDSIGALERVIKLSGTIDDEIWARSVIIDIYDRQSQVNLLKNTANKVVNLKPQSQEGFKNIAKVKFFVGKLDAKDVVEINPMTSKNLVQATQEVVKKYEKAKLLLLSPCEVPGLEWCSVGYYETSKLAEGVTKILLEIEAPPTLEIVEADKIKALVLKESDRIAEEVKTYANQAEEALSIGVPYADLAERIKTWAQTQRGETDTPQNPGQ